MTIGAMCLSRVRLPPDLMSTNFFEFREKLTARRGEPPAAMEAAPGKPQPAPLTVTQLTFQIDRAIRAGMPGTVLVKGEVSNF